MIKQTSLVQDLLMADEGAILDHEIHNVEQVTDVKDWYATDAETAAKALIEQRPAIIAHFGYWVGEAA